MSLFSLVAEKRMMATAQKKTILIAGISLAVILVGVLIWYASPSLQEALFGEAIRGGSRALGGSACTPDRWNYWIVGSAEEVGLSGTQETLLFSSGNGWQRTSLEHLNLGEVDFQEVWGSSPRDVWAVGKLGTVLKYDGGSWQKLTLPRRNPLAGNSFYSVWGTSRRDIWVGTGHPTFSSFEDGTLHYNGRSWTSFITNEAVYGLWGTSARDIWAIGSGFILHYDGSRRTPAVERLSSALFDVWGTSPRDVWAVGESGTILHYDGVQWAPQASGTLNTLTAIWGSSHSDVWAVGAEGTLLHFDGTSWTRQQVPERLLPAESHLENVFGSSARDIFVIGGNGLILHYDGRSWELQNANTAATLTAGQAVKFPDTCGEGSHCTAGRCVPQPVAN